jgi:hypothetical protein
LASSFPGVRCAMVLPLVKAPLVLDSWGCCWGCCWCCWSRLAVFGSSESRKALQGKAEHSESFISWTWSRSWLIPLYLTWSHWIHSPSLRWQTLMAQTAFGKELNKQVSMECKSWLLGQILPYHLAWPWAWI